MNLNNRINEYYEKYLKNNVRRNSLKQVLEILCTGNYKEMVELGCSRCDFEGCSTLLFSIVSEHFGSSFHSVDISKESIDFSTNLISSYSEDKNLLNTTTLFQMDQYDYLKNRNSKIDFLYIDASDGAKNMVLDFVTNQIDILNDGALILLDDQCNAGDTGETCNCIEVVNNSKNLHPIDKKIYFELCEEEQRWENEYKQYECKNNNRVYLSGVRQHVFQILLEYKK
jgi:hypothetical protein